MSILSQCYSLKLIGVEILITSNIVQFLFNNHIKMIRHIYKLVKFEKKKKAYLNEHHPVLKYCILL